MYKGKPILVCSDFHMPYHHRHIIEFLKAVHRLWGCHDSIVHAGDLFDFHAMSKHLPELDTVGPDNEYSKALIAVQRFTSSFPYGVLVLGNHDRIPQRQMKEIRLSEKLLKTLNDLYGLPKSWKVETLFHTICNKQVLIEHSAEGTSGPQGALKGAIAKRSSYVKGHNHAYAGCLYHANHNSLIFGLNTGCGCDNKTLATRYAQYNLHKGVLGCGVVVNECEAYFVPMPLGNK